ncbi:hypothetical protein GCM10027568_11040 [Humibacter soli]
MSSNEPEEKYFRLLDAIDQVRAGDAMAAMETLWAAAKATEYPGNTAFDYAYLLLRFVEGILAGLSKEEADRIVEKARGGFLLASGLNMLNGSGGDDASSNS